jgi:hypothetical protein
MAGNNSKDHARNGRDPVRRPVVAAHDAENLLVVIVTSWIFAAAALVFYGKFNLILLLIAGGFVTVLLVLTSALSLFSAVTLQKLASRLKQS